MRTVWPKAGRKVTAEIVWVEQTNSHWPLPGADGMVIVPLASAVAGVSCRVETPFGVVMAKPVLGVWLL